MRYRLAFHSCYRLQAGYCAAVIVNTTKDTDHFQRLVERFKWNSSGTDTDLLRRV